MCFRRKLWAEARAHFSHFTYSHSFSKRDEGGKRRPGDKGYLPTKGRTQTKGDSCVNDSNNSCSAELGLNT